MQWSLAEIAHRYGMPTVDAARMAVNRAVKRLSADLRRAGNNKRRSVKTRAAGCTNVLRLFFCTVTACVRRRVSVR